MNKSRIALVLLVVAALAAVGFSAAGSDTSGKKVDASCDAGCSSCCHK